MLDFVPVSAVAHAVLFLELCKPLVLVFLVLFRMLLLGFLVVPMFSLENFGKLFGVVLFYPGTAFPLNLGIVSWMLLAPFCGSLDFTLAVGLVPGFMRLALDFLLAWLSNPPCGASALRLAAFRARVR